MTDAYEMVIGLEVHVELKTASKIFCGCGTAFGAPPNTQCCPVCTGMPGALPVLNQRVVEYAVKAGLATHCSIAPYSKNDRKNYFYPDLPKAYQISQFNLPLCREGYLDIEAGDGQKRVGITRIHIEEDAGKLVHNEQLGTLIDMNRCGVPLIEIVSEPDLRNAEEAVAYLKKLRAVVLYTGISDARMNEGSLRCDVNLSVRKKGEAALGTRTEMKNLNSFGFVARAIGYEFARQVKAIEAGEAIVQETRRFDAATGKTHSMRTKEVSSDYRYFPEPDLLPIVTPEEEVRRIGREIPPLPDERKQRYQAQWGLSGYHAEMLVLEKAVADYFEEAARHTAHPQLLANLMISEVFRLRGEDAEDAPIPVPPQSLAAVADMLGEGQVNSGGGKKLLGALWAQPGADPAALVQSMGLRQIADEGVLKEIAQRVVAQNPKMAADYKGGKQAAFKALMGKAMAETAGRADPVLLQALLQEALKG